MTFKMHLKNFILKNTKNTKNANIVKIADFNKTVYIDLFKILFKCILLNVIKKI